MEEHEDPDVAAEPTAAEPETLGGASDGVFTLTTNDPDSTVWISLPATGSLSVVTNAQPGQAAVVHEGEPTWINPPGGTFQVEQGDSLTYSIRDESFFSLSWGYQSG